MNVLAKPITPETAKDFFEQIDGLEMDYVRANQKSTRRAWRVAGVAVTVALLEGFAIASLAPIHTVEWRLLRVDNAGPVEVVTTLDKGQVFTDANARYFLGQYVRMRESYYDPEKLYNFHVVGLMSDPAEQQRYAETIKGSNPISPQTVFAHGGFERVKIESTAILGKGLGQVAFSREEHTDQSSVAKITRWVATIGFTIRPDAKMKDADRNENPLGFQVVSYHIDAVNP
jgi:type IV secretory pathway component VirB8